MEFGSWHIEAFWFPNLEACYYFVFVFLCLLLFVFVVHSFLLLCYFFDLLKSLAQLLFKLFFSYIGHWTHSFSVFLSSYKHSSLKSVSFNDMRCNNFIIHSKHFKYHIWFLLGPSIVSVQFSSVQSLSRVRLFATPWTAALQASLSVINSRSLLKLMSIELVIPSNHLILCCPFLLPSSIFPSIRVCSN